MQYCAKKMRTKTNLESGINEINSSSSEKLWILVELRNVNHLRNYYSGNNFPISNVTDSFFHFWGEALFTKWNCSQAYHCAQMGDPLQFDSHLSILLEVTLQGLSKSITGVNSLFRSALDPCSCAQFVRISNVEWRRSSKWSPHLDAYLIEKVWI